MPRIFQPIKNAVQTRSLYKMMCSKPRPVVSHLFFAYGSLIFFKASHDDYVEIKRILGSYEKASGQVINLMNSAITFSPNVDLVLKRSIVDCLGL